MMKKYYENENEQVQDTLHIYTRVSSPIHAAMWDNHPELCVDRDKELGIKKANELGMKYQVWDEGRAFIRGEGDWINKREIS